MRKCIIIFAAMCTLLIACAPYKQTSVQESVIDESENKNEILTESSCPYALMHGGVLYYYTGEYIFDDVEYKEEDILGRVSSTVTEMEMPSENGQANIPIEGSIYIKNSPEDSNILVLINGKWYIFERRNNGTSDTDQEHNKLPVQEPPLLKVIAHNGESINAMRTSYSWIYTDENGEENGIIADGLHPLKAKEYMPHLAVKPSVYSRIDSKTLYLDFAYPPDRITAEAWKAQDYGNANAESIPVVINDAEYDGQNQYFTVDIFGEEYVYSITAHWESRETGGFEGTAYYCFTSELYFPEISGTEITVAE